MHATKLKKVSTRDSTLSVRLFGTRLVTAMAPTSMRFSYKVTTSVGRRDGKSWPRVGTIKLDTGDTMLLLDMEINVSMPPLIAVISCLVVLFERRLMVRGELREGLGYWRKD